MSARHLDVVLFGATGFTGHRTAEYLAKNYVLTHPSYAQVASHKEPQAKGTGLSWAIAGRHTSKLESVRASLVKDFPSRSEEMARIPIIYADSFNEQSLKDMACQTRVVMSTVGPFDKYGELLVKACAESGTHYCDITGEVQFVYDMKAKYSEAAEQSGAKIVSFCGFDSIPSDLGTFFAAKVLKEKQGCDCDQIDAYFTKLRGSFSGGTMASFLNTFDRSWSDLKEMAKKVGSPYGLCDKGKPRIRQPSPQKMPWYSGEIGRLTFPFVMSAVNTRVVHWTNSLLDMQYGKEFKYTECATARPNMTGTITAMISSALPPFLTTMSMFSLTRNVLKKFGPEPGAGPSDEQLKKGCFELTLIARGPQVPAAADRRVVVAVRGHEDPGYTETCKFLVESGVCLATDPDVAAKPGGFYSPGALMADALIARLRKKGVDFESIDSKL